MAQGLTNDSFKCYLMNAKTKGITKEEIVETITYAVFYMGWAKAWVVFHMAK